MRSRTDDQRIALREATPADARTLLALKRQLDQETSFMLLEPDERSADVAEMRSELERIDAAANSVVIVATSGETLVGYAELSGGVFRRNARTAELVIGRAATASSQGVGAQLLGQAEAWARRYGLHRIELTVMAHNARAIRVYERHGFQVEGRRQQCLLVDGRYVDELYMAKLLANDS
jgi:RimJ/RimL family protein N-acetyltransferase